MLLSLSSIVGVQFLPSSPALCTTHGKCNRILSGLELSVKSSSKSGSYLWYIIWPYAQFIYLIKNIVGNSEVSATKNIFFRQSVSLVTTTCCKKSFSTRITKQSCSLLDHMLINSLDSVSHAVVVGVGLSDHLLFYCRRKITVTKFKVVRNKINEDFNS